MISYDNFYKATHGTFSQCKHPNRKPDFITYDKFSLKPISFYWYGSDVEGDYVIRKSDHWCILHNISNGKKRTHLQAIKDCKWHITFYKDNFIKKKRILLKQSFIIGKVYIKNLSHRYI
jgi:hypothetical protein